MSECVKKSDGEAVKALLLAVHGGREGEVKRLLLAGVDVNLADADGFTPLMASAMNGNFMIARMLLNAGADPGKCNKWNMTAHAIAVFHGHGALAELLGERLQMADEERAFRTLPDPLSTQNRNPPQQNGKTGDRSRPV